MTEQTKYEPLLTIGTVAEKLGIAVQTVRLYEQEGLVIAHKTNGGQRKFSLHDLERLQCIRKMITENGMNLQGIRKMLSLIPCWEFKGGLDEECKKCSAYYEANGPCWHETNVGSKCVDQNCRECLVYKMDISCEKIKELIFSRFRDHD